MGSPPSHSVANLFGLVVAGTGEQVHFKYNVEGMSEADIEELLKRVALAGEERTNLYPNNPKQFVPWQDITEAKDY